MTRLVPGGDSAVVVRAAESELIGFPPQSIRLLVDSPATAGRLSAQRVTLNNGVDGANPHHHSHSAELFFVLGGSVQLLVGDEVVVAEPGDLALVPPGLAHAFAAAPACDADLLIVITPGVERFEYFRLLASNRPRERVAARVCATCKNCTTRSSRTARPGIGPVEQVEISMQTNGELTPTWRTSSRSPSRATTPSISARCSSPTTSTTTPTCTQVPGPDSAVSFFKDWLQAFPDAEVVCEDALAVGTPSAGTVVGRFTYTGTFTEPMMGMPPTGKRVVMRSIDIWRVRDGRLAEHWDELNTADWFAQLQGADPQPRTGATV